MRVDEPLTKRLKASPDARSDAGFFLFVLVCSLAYIIYASIDYVTWFQNGYFDIDHRPVGRDFVNYWTGGVAVLQGEAAQLFRPDSYPAYQQSLFPQELARHYWSYPPHLLLLVWPLGGLPYLWALALWLCTTLGLYLWAAVGRGNERWVLLFALLLAPASYINFIGGQNGFLTAALLIGGLRLLGSRPIVAGILFGLLTVKPQLGILLPFALLAGRHWSAIASATVTTVVLVSASVALFGWQSWQDYVELIVPLQSAVMNELAGGYLAMMPSPYIALTLLGVDIPLRSVIQGIFTLGSLAAVFWAFARTADWGLRLGVLAVGTLLASPYSFNYDMTMLSLVAAHFALRGLREGFLPGERVLLAVVWLAPCAVLWFNQHFVPVGPLILLACFGYLLAQCRQQPGRLGAGWRWRITGTAGV